MAKKANKRLTGFGNHTCTVCGEKAHTKAASQHRRCNGPGLPIRDKRDKLPSAKRGTWA